MSLRRSALVLGAAMTLGGGWTAQAANNAVTTIEVVSVDHRWTAEIEATPAGRDFLAQLPLQLTLKGFGGNEMIADLPRPVTREGAPAAVMPHAGDVAFYAPWGNLALFYADGHDSPGLIPLGRFKGGTANLKSDRPVAVSIRAVPSSQ